MIFSASFAGTGHAMLTGKQSRLQRPNPKQIAFYIRTGMYCLLLLTGSNRVIAHNAGGQGARTIEQTITDVRTDTTITVRGVVTNAKGQSVAGANVIVKGSI